MSDLDTLVDLCSPGSIHTRGPLNNTYIIEIDGHRLFVRERLISDSSYGQQFAGERHLSNEVRAMFNVPALLAVVEDAGRERYAVFEYIDGQSPNWNDPAMRRILGDTLVSLHQVEGPGFGDLGTRLARMPAGAYIRTLIEVELASLRYHLQEADLKILKQATDAAACLFDTESPTLCHGDIHGDNFIVDSQGNFWIVDWEAVRFRVAAADFNQMHYSWLKPRQVETLMQRYCDARSLDPVEFGKQATTLRMLWDIRTYNFRVEVLKQPRALYRHHLRSAIWHAEVLR